MCSSVLDQWWEAWKWVRKTRRQIRTESEQHKEQYTESNKSQHTHTNYYRYSFFLSLPTSKSNRLVVRGCPHLLHTCTLLHTRLHNELSAERRNTCRQLNMLHIPIQQNNLQPCVLMCNLCLHGFTLQFRVKPMCLCTDETIKQHIFWSIY